MKRPRYLFFWGILLFACSFFLTPQFFIWLGPLRASLLSDIPAVKEFAELEVFVARLMSFGLGLCVLSAWFFWSKIAESQLAQWINHHQPAYQFDHNILNVSFMIMIIFFVVIVGLVYTATRLPDFDLLRAMEEDGFVEYATAFVFLLCSLFSGYLALTIGVRRKQVMHFLLCIGFFLCFGEEISWGQRILGFSTPEALQEINVQGEFNIHNSFGYLADHIFIAGVFLYGAVLPFLASRSLLVVKLVDLSGLPLASLGLACGFLLASLLHNWTVYVILPWTPIRIAEPREFLSSIGFLLLMWEVLRNSKRSY